MPIGFLLRNTFRLPMILGKTIISLFLPHTRYKRRPVVSLPVAGLDENLSRSIASSLKQTELDAEIIEAWLSARQLVQVVYNRLLLDLDKVENDLAYWEASLKARHHTWSMFVEQGPLKLFQRLQRRFQTGHADLSATDMMEQRLTLLRGLEKRLVGAIACVHNAAMYLRIKEKHAPDLPTNDFGFQRRVFLHTKCCLVNISNLLRRLRLENQTGESELSEATQSLRNELSPNQESSFDFKEDMWSAADEEDLKILKELTAKIQLYMDVTLQAQLQQPVSDMLRMTQLISRQTKVLVDVPQNARGPSMLQRHWVRYTLYAFFGGSILRFLINHSPLVGSKDMQKWFSSIYFALEAHVLDPLKNLTEEVFDTFHGAPGIVSKEDYELSKDSLLRMLKDFKQDHLVNQKGSEPPASEESMIEGMDTLMKTYETELKNPLWNIVTGRLARALLIQVQKLKVDTESAMLELDQILRANELNVALIAAIPSLLVAGAIFYLLFASINRAGPDPTKSLIPCRLTLIELHRALSQSLEETESSDEAHGRVLHKLEKTYKACWNVFRSRDITSTESEWPSLYLDFIELARPQSIKQKIKICDRMKLTYSIFQV